MANIYKGKEPCPGCGCTGEEHPRAFKDKLCDECADTLAFGQEMRSKQAYRKNE